MMSSPACRHARLWQRLATLALIWVALGPATASAQQTSAEPPWLRVWHFAEGRSSGEIRTYFLIHNLRDQPTAVRAEYQRDDGIRLTQWLGVPARGRVSFDAGDIVGQGSFGASFYADSEIVVERSILLDNHPSEAGAGGQQLLLDGLSTFGFAPDGMQAWHFADGSTRGQTETFYVIRNLTDSPATVTATFVTGSGRRLERQLLFAPRERLALAMRELLPDDSFGASFVANRAIVVERTVYTRGARGLLGGLGYAGAAEGATTWYFAEGSSKTPFATFFILFNPGPRPASVTLTFEGDRSAQTVLQLAPGSRLAYNPAAVLPEAEFATTVQSSEPIIVERSSYSLGAGLLGAVGYSPGFRSDGRHWSFAEGNTSGRIETFFIVRSLAESPTTVQARLFPMGREPIELQLPLAAGARIALRANDVVPGTTFAASFSADVSLVVERIVTVPGWGSDNVVGIGTAADAP